jgi:hypothetical protein
VTLAFSAGADMKAVGRMLGHASAKVTLDLDANRFDDDLVAVAVALDRTAMETRVAERQIRAHWDEEAKSPAPL